jgi:hypothetical protein
VDGIQWIYLAGSTIAQGMSSGMTGKHVAALHTWKGLQKSCVPLHKAFAIPSASLFI